MNTIININKLSKIFSANEIETLALNKVSFDIKEGEFVAIMGPSGCGKSTLLNLIGLLDNPSGGKYYYYGQEISVLSEKQRAKLRKANIGFVFQNFNLIDELTVFENIELPLIYLGIKSSERRERVEKILEEMHITHRKKYFPMQLSGGQQQRTAIARAIITQPKIILADEPTGNLDSTHGQKVMMLLEKLNRNGTTIIMVTHSPSDAEYAQRVIRLFDGQIVTENIRPHYNTKNI
ncbi:MAG: ABC transporter ATP-binding protein [Bacteroidota bacterium]|nr:ABC transporter ATP-binding protein [Bacteroidota bacterium]